MKRTKMKRVNIYISESDLKYLKLEAVKKDTNVSRIVSYFVSLLRDKVIHIDTHSK